MSHTAARRSDAGFAWVRAPWGRVVRSRGLARVARHAFTTRQLRLRSDPAEERQEWSAIAAFMGVEPGRLARARQVHGREAMVIRAGEGWRDDGQERPEADILVSDDPGAVLAVQVADCVPLLIADPATGAAAAAHAGWRGMAAGVPEAAVSALTDHFGAIPARLVAAAGPSIGPCCYEVGPEVREAFLAGTAARGTVDAWLSAAGPGPPGRDRRAGHFMLDLWRALELQLSAAGMDPASIHVSRLCTACQPGEWWSYRRDGPGTGRLAGVIRPGRPLRPSPGLRGDPPRRSGCAARARR